MRKVNRAIYSDMKDFKCEEYGSGGERELTELTCLMRKPIVKETFIEAIKAPDGIVSSCMRCGPKLDSIIPPTYSENQEVWAPKDFVPGNNKDGLAML